MERGVKGGGEGRGERRWKRIEGGEEVENPDSTEDSCCGKGTGGWLKYRMFWNGGGKLCRVKSVQWGMFH